MKTIIGEIKENAIFAVSKSKEEIDEAVQKVIESRINSGRMKVADIEKLSH
jgi:hypothetical protein